jgi:hypothetical protein
MVPRAALKTAEGEGLLKAECLYTDGSKGIVFVPTKCAVLDFNNTYCE